MIEKIIQYGAHQLKLSTGKIARQATAAVMAEIDGTIVFVTVMASKEINPEMDFFPLRVDYQEKYYAAGKFLGGFIKREGRPSEREILISRLIDRPIRPLFPKGYTGEVQILATVLSINPEIEPDVVAMLGASAALSIAGVPFNGPMGAARVGYIDGKYILNPTQKELAESKLDLVVAGTIDSVLMVESEAKELSEDIMLGAVMYGQREFRSVITGISEFAQEVAASGKDINSDWWKATDIKTDEPELVNSLGQSALSDIAKNYQIKNKQERIVSLQQLRAAIIAERTEGHELESAALTTKKIHHVLDHLERDHVRDQILSGQPRIDGRDLETVRQINVETGILKRTHGSSLFTRGETQALVIVTLGSGRDAQQLDSAFAGERKEDFMLHYNFPSYSVGELGMPNSPKRREIGHGRLAWRAVKAVLPELKDFPYVKRIVSEITESNGSSSMATVCGASLALMDAGVPIKAPVAGIAMGLIKDADRFAVLTDILGDEDHLGDMDFKVAGTATGVTALQMDIKIGGITEEIMHKALAQAQRGRMHILGIMNQEISAPRAQLSKFAPQIVTFKIDPSKVRDVVGKGGSTIKQITESSQATIDLQDDGTVQIFAPNTDALNNARTQIELITTDIEVGQVYEGKVVRIAEFGAFVNILPGKDGLLHVSQIAHHRVNDVRDELTEGQMVEVKVIEIDRQGRIKLSKKVLTPMPEQQPANAGHGNFDDQDSEDGEEF